MMKKVLIALDYDPTAQKVAETGFSMAKAMNAEITLLHVVSDPAYYVPRNYETIMGFTGFIDSGPVQLDNLAEIKKSAQKFLDKTKRHLGDETIETLIRKGDFADSILHAAKDLHADMIVLGSHSQKWLENIVMGSVTEKVLHHTTVPLCIVPTKKHK